VTSPPEPGKRDEGGIAHLEGILGLTQSPRLEAREKNTRHCKTMDMNKIYTLHHDIREFQVH